LKSRRTPGWARYWEARGSVAHTDGPAGRRAFATRRLVCHLLQL
jgi:hypothetical protein